MAEGELHITRDIDEGVMEIRREGETFRVGVGEVVTEAVLYKGPIDGAPDEICEPDEDDSAPMGGFAEPFQDDR